MACDPNAQSASIQRRAISRTLSGDETILIEYRNTTWALGHCVFDIKHGGLAKIRKPPRSRIDEARNNSAPKIRLPTARRFRHLPTGAVLAKPTTANTI